MEDEKIQEQVVEETTTPQEEVKEAIAEDKQEESKEEMITISKKEFEERLSNKLKEGERKATEKAQKSAQAENNELRANNDALQSQINALNQTIKMDELGIVKDKQTSLITLIIADGKEATNDVIEEYANRYSEWKKKEATKGIEDFGQNKVDEVVDEDKEINDYRMSKGLPPITRKKK